MTLLWKLADLPVPLVAFSALAAYPDMPGRIAGVVVFNVPDGSTVLATVLAAVAEAGGCETSGNCSTFDSVSSSFDGVNVMGVSSVLASGSSLGPSETNCSSIGGGKLSVGIVSSTAGVGVASSSFATGTEAGTFFGAGGGFANSPAQPPTLFLLEAAASVLFSLAAAAGVSVLASLPHPPPADVSAAPFVGVSHEVVAGVTVASPQPSSVAFAVDFVPLVCTPALAPRLPRLRSAPRPRPRPPRVPPAASADVVDSLALDFFFPTSPHWEMVPSACQYNAIPTLIEAIPLVILSKARLASPLVSLSA